MNAILKAILKAIRRLRDRITIRSVKKAVDQLRDPLGIGLAVATAILAYILAAKLEHAVAVGLAVLVVRIGAGLLMPPQEDQIPSPDVLTDEERAIAKLVGEEKTNAEIAERRELTTKAVAKRITVIQKALGYETREEVAAWAALVFPRPKIRREAIYEKWIVRTILMAGGFISLGLSIYNISRIFWPEFFAQ